MATATTTPEQQQRIKAALSEGYRSVSKFWNENFALLVEVLGLRIRRPLTVEQFTMAAIAYSEGCSLRQQTSDHIELVMRPTGPTGRSRSGDCSRCDWRA
jgi:hypothetical protein